MYHSSKTPSPILIPGYKFTKTRQMVSLDDVTTTYPAHKNARVMKQKAPHFNQLRKAGFLLITKTFFFSQVLGDFVYDEHFWRLVAL